MKTMSKQEIYKRIKQASLKLSSRQLVELRERIEEREKNTKLEGLSNGTRKQVYS